MEEGLVQIYSGEGHGKSAAAIGRALQAACNGENVVIIRFLKGMQNDDFLKRLEPEIKIFRFEKSEEEFSQLSAERQQEEIHNIKNGLNFAKKVLTTGECSLLILDVGIIMTGIHLEDKVCELADEISKIEEVNYKIFRENTMQS